MAPVSEILCAYAEIKSYSEKNRSRLLQKAAELKNARRSLMHRAMKAGLKIRDSNFPEALDDIFETDDAGKLVDTFFKVKVSSIEDVQTAVTFCRDEKILALPIGAKTSALGVFEARGLAERFGLKGIIGISFDAIPSKDIAPAEPTTKRIELPQDLNPLHHTVWSTSGALAAIYSKDYESTLIAPRIVVHAGCHIADVNSFLETALPSERIRFRLMPDPTSKSDAQIGGIVATGAEGGNRSQASEDLFGLTIVDADGALRILRDGDAKNIVGLNGNAGMICQAEFLATAFPKYEHGIFIPLSGVNDAAWKNALLFQERCKPYCFSAHSDPRIQIGAGDGGIIVTGIEILSKHALEIAIKDSENRFEWVLLELMQGADFGIFVTYSSFYSAENEKLFAQPFVKECIGLSIEVAETDQHENFIINNHALFSKIRLLSGEELSHMDTIRHSAPSHSRELARRMGGVTESTDLNIRFTSTNPEETGRAIESVAKLYAEYAAYFTKESGFQVSTYGHLHPGVGAGGGIDPHVRVIFELSNPGSRYNAPEQVSELKKRHNALLRSLLNLNGIDGIKILPPEKGKFASAEFWNWFCLTFPAEARRYLELCVDLGIGKSETGDQLATIAGRLPHVLPGILKPLRNGVLGLLDASLVLEADSSIHANSMYNPKLSRFWPAIAKLSQAHHKGGRIRRMLSHTLLRAQEYFKIPDDSYLFCIESTEEASHILERNFGSSDIYTTTVMEPQPIEGASLGIQPGAFYAIDLKHFKIPTGLALLVVPHEAILKAYTLHVQGKNKATFRNLYEMWSGWPFDTLETPHIPAIASLGLLLDSERWSYQQTKERPVKAISADTGPTLLHPAVTAAIQPLGLSATPHHAGTQTTAIAALKDFIGISQEYEIGFTGSATQAMQLLSDALMKNASAINIIQVVNDVSGERLNAILKKSGVPCTTLISSWTTGENSQLNDVTEKIISALKPNAANILIITPHKTSTTADVLPDHIIRKLGAAGHLMGHHYHMICDITSGVGARNYATLLSPDTGLMRMPFTGCIGACNRALGVPAGLGFISLSPALVKILGIGGDSSDRFTLAGSFKASRAGNVINAWGLALLGSSIEARASKNETIAQIEKECRQKMNLILGWLEQHHDLIALVPNAYDRSPLIMGIFSQAKNMIVTKRLLNEIFGIQVGVGYGPFEREGIRIYIPMITKEDVKELLASLDVILQLDDVVRSRGENIPNIALREPHDPLAVITRVAESCTVDDIIKDQLGLDWLGRLIQTFNANVANASQKVQIGGKVPHISSGHHAKAQIYGESNNLREMRKILLLRNEETKLELMFYYKLYKETENHLRDRILGVPTATWDDQDFCPAVLYLLDKAREHLTDISRLLKKYVDGYTLRSVDSHDATSMREVKASRDIFGRVEWPIVA